MRLTIKKPTTYLFCILIEIRQLEWFFQSKTGKIVSKTRISISRTLFSILFPSEKTRIDGFLCVQTQNAKRITTFLVALIAFQWLNAQRIDNNTWKAQIALGINSPSKVGFINTAPAQSLNFPTVNLGIQHMFSKTIGAKLDYGFNRFRSESNNPEFKVNYSRINAQFVYNFKPMLTFLPEPMALVAHTGPGLSTAKPLGTLGDNKQSYFNWNAGIELHYAINRKVALYADLSYIYGFSNLENYNPESNGLGAFNGSVINLTFGASIALSGCRYCD